MKTLFQTKSIDAVGTAESQMKTVYEQINFASPTDILVQLHLSNLFLNRQSDSFWNIGLTIDSYELVENGVKTVKTVGANSSWKNMEIAKCTWVKVRLEYKNGGGSGIINIFKEATPIRIPGRINL